MAWDWRHQRGGVVALISGIRSLALVVAKKGMTGEENQSMARKKHKQ